MILAAGYRLLPFLRACRGQPEGEAATFLQTSRGRVGLVRCVLIWVRDSPRPPANRIPMNKEAGGPQRQCLSRNRNRVQRQANIAPAAPPVGRPCRFDSSRDGGAAGHSYFSIRDDRFIHHAGKSTFLAG